MINFTRAFDTAWERMVIILFRPFDLGKWLIIGLSTFLAGLIYGGNGFNGSFNFNSPDQSISNKQLSGPNNLLNGWSSVKVHSTLSHVLTGMQVGFIVILIIGVFLFALVIGLLMCWLGARGQFLLLDNIVRNRGSVGEPWQRYSRPANSLFVFYVLLTFVSFVILVPIFVVGGVMSLPLFCENRWPIGGEIIDLVCLGGICLALTLILSIVCFIYLEFGVPLMFRNGLSARTAFVESMQLIVREPLSIVVFLLLRLALAFALGILSVMTCCCCCGFLPYVGTVVLLPALIYVRCFTLDCLAQFGPQYDIFTVDVPPPTPVVPSPFSPPPRLG
jgi:hypothetical protein